MALPKLFQRIFWHNNTTPAINEDNLNAMSKGLSDVDDRLISLAGTIQEDVVEIQEDMEILNAALETIDDSVASAQESASTASAKAIITSNKALVAEGFAVGEQNGTEVGQDSEYYQNNAKYYAEIANPPIENTVDFTDIITISDAINKAAKDVRLKVEAIQNLHGYDKPWVGGVGKNKMFFTVASIKAANTGGTWNGNAYTIGGLTFTLLTDSGGNVTGIKINGTDANTEYFNITKAAGETLPAGNYVLNGGVNTNIRVYDNGDISSAGGDAEFTLSETTAKRWILRVNSGANPNNLIAYPMVRLSGQSNTYESPTNICPISGWDNAKVTREGKNLLENTATAQTINGVTFTVNSDGSVTANGTATTQINFSIKNQIPTEWIGKSLKLSGCPIGGGSNTYEITLWDGDASTAIMRDYGNGASGIPLHTNSWVNFTIRTGATLNNAIIKPMITFADTPNSDYDHFEPYQGEEITISLGGTRYGGTLDVTSGVLTLDKGYAEFDGSVDENWTKHWDTDTPNICMIANGLPSYKTITTTIGVGAISNIYQWLPYDATYEGLPSLWSVRTNNDYKAQFAINRLGQLVIKDIRYTTVEDFKTYLQSNPLQIVYDIEPQTIQLTPTQVYLLYGYNILFGDCGDISLTYDASGIIHIEEAKLDTETLKTIAAASSDFADFKARIAAL